MYKPVPASIRGSKKGIIMDGILIHLLETFQLHVFNYFSTIGVSTDKSINFFIYSTRIA